MSLPVLFFEVLKKKKIRNSAGAEPAGKRKKFKNFPFRVAKTQLNDFYYFYTCNINYAPTNFVMFKRNYILLYKFNYYFQISRNTNFQRANLCF